MSVTHEDDNESLSDNSSEYTVCLDLIVVMKKWPGNKPVRIVHYFLPLISLRKFD